MEHVQCSLVSMCIWSLLNIYNLSQIPPNWVTCVNFLEASCTKRDSCCLKSLAFGHETHLLLSWPQYIPFYLQLNLLSTCFHFICAGKKPLSFLSDCRTILPLLSYFSSFSKTSLLYLCGSISGLLVVFHWAKCLFFCQNHAVLTILDL